MDGNYEFNLLDYSPNVFHDYFAGRDRTIGFSSIKSDPLSDHVSSRLRADENIEINMEIAINGSPVTEKRGNRLLSKGNIESIFGNNLSISISPLDGKTFKIGDTKKEVSIYVPKKLILRTLW